MLDFTGINYWAVIVAWLISIIIGGFWYSPAGFGKKWSKMSGVDMMKTPKAETARAIRFVAISCVFQVFALAVVLHSLDVQTVWQGIQASLFLWFSFVAITTIGNTLYQRQTLGFWWLNASYFLVVMAINGVLFAAWQ